MVPTSAIEQIGAADSGDAEIKGWAHGVLETQKGRALSIQKTFASVPQSAIVSVGAVGLTAMSSVCRCDVPNIVKVYTCICNNSFPCDRIGTCNPVYSVDDIPPLAL